MKKIILFAIAFTIFIGLRTALADGLHFDPFERNLIFVEGEAEITVPINGFSLSFGFDIEKATFDEASQESTRIIEKISANARELGLSDIEIIKGWDLVKQAKISLGSKGRKISNRLIVKVLHFPEGKLHELMSKIIDKSLSVDNSVGLEDVNVFVSEDIENKKKRETQVEALRVLDSNAARVAEILGRKLSAPKRIFISSEEVHFRQEQSLSERVYYDGAALSSIVSIQKGFKVKAQIVDHMKISAKVTGIYQVE